MILIALVAVGCWAGGSLEELDREVITQEEVDYINSVQDLWVASRAWVGSMTVREARSILSPLSSARNHEYEVKSTEILEAPTSFDARTQWPNCVVPIGIQGDSCSAGFAFASTGSLSYRHCVASKRYQGVYLSPQYMLNCGAGNSLNCKTGLIDDAWSFLQTSGTGVNTCIPYTGIIAACSSTCSNGTPVTLYNAGPSTEYGDVASIQTAIMASGPIASTMIVYGDFLTYKSGVYTRVSGASQGTQSVIILGWGVSGTTNYWICANSWGTTWGILGYFWIAFGQCAIEANGVAANAAI